MRGWKESWQTTSGHDGYAAREDDVGVMTR